MMTEEQRIEWLLELQDHPEQLTEEQLQQILADDEMRQLVQQLGFAKRAFMHDALKNNTTDVDAEWEVFAANHTSELNALNEGEHKPHFRMYLSTHKIAASFIGVLLASGIAFAAIWSLTPSPSPMEGGEETTHVDGSRNESKHSSLPERGVGGEAPYIFNNVPLDSMLTVIAAAHGFGVEFENDAARQLRFHFVWKREDNLMRVVEKLNTFETVNIGMEEKKLVVR